MKAFSILMTALMALIALPDMAAADTRAIYTIAEIPVDKTASNTREAEAQAFAEAKIIGLRRLIARITLPEDRAALGEGFYSLANANELASAVDVDNERRSSTIYRADLSVVYNPTRVRAKLKQYGVPYLDQPAPTSLLAPVSQDPLLLDKWRAAWPQANYGALNPYVKGLAFYSTGDEWSDVASEVRAVNAGNAVFAELSGTEGNYRVHLIRQTAGGGTTVGVTNPVETMEDAVAAATAYLGEAWKHQSIIRDASRTRSTASVYYDNLSDWNKLRNALSRSALISDFRVDAISRDGALVTFLYAGDDTRLKTELRQYGVLIDHDGEAWSMRLGFGG